MSNSRPRKKRKYQPIWEALKKKERVVLEVRLVFVARVKKAIIKEKNMDVGFKVVNDFDDFYLEFDYNPEKQLMTVLLKSRIGIEDRRD
jgi:hypothetical protein